MWDRIYEGINNDQAGGKGRKEGENEREMERELEKETKGLGVRERVAVKEG